MKITRISNLASCLDWIEKRMLASKPRELIPTACVAVFRKLIEDLKPSTGFSFALEPTSLLQTISSQIGVVESYGKLPDFLLACAVYNADYTYGDEMCIFVNVPAFIELADDELGLGLRLRHCDKRVMVRSTSRLEESEGVHVKFAFKLF